MGNIRHEILSRLIKCIHLLQHTVKCIHDMLCFYVIRHTDRFIRVALLHLTDRSRYPVKGPDQNFSQDNCQRQNTQSHNNLDNQCFPAQNGKRHGNTVGGNTGQHHATYHFRSLRLFWRCVLFRNGLHNRNRNLNKPVHPVIICRIGALKTLNNLLGDNRLSFAESIGILHNFQTAVNNHHTPVIQIGKLLELCINHFR